MKQLIKKTIFTLLMGLFLVHTQESTYVPLSTFQGAWCNSNIELCAIGNIQTDHTIY